MRLPGDASTLLLVASGAASIACIVLGLYLWLPARNDPAARSDAGSALLAGAVVALAVFLLQLGTDVRSRRNESRRADQQVIQDLKLQVAIRDKLEGFDFRDVRGERRDLSGFYFRGKKLAEADFRGITLKEADFTGADLSRAKLDGATLDDGEFISTNLEGAFLIDAHLKRADLTSACLRGSRLTGADLTGADITGADLSDAEFDSETTWTDGRKRKCGAESCFIKPQAANVPTTCPS